MPDLPSPGELTTLFDFLAPGIIILWVRGRFRDATPPKLSEKLLNYAGVSVAYNAAAYPIFHLDGWVMLSEPFWRLALVLVTPILVSTVIVFFDRSEKFYEVTAKLGFRPVHHIPTAWDRVFRDPVPSYVLFHMADGSEIAGAWTEGAFASSVSTDRDVFVPDLFKVGDDGTWTQVDPPRSMLICGGNIRMVEFIKGNTQ